MTVKYYPDREDIVAIDSIAFDTDNITVNNIYDMSIVAVKGLIGSWIMQVLEEFEDATIDNKEFTRFWEDIDNKGNAHLDAEMAELEDYITVDMIVDITDNTLTMKLDTWG